MTGDADAVMIRPLLICLIVASAALPAAAVPTAQAPLSEVRAFERARELIEVTGAEQALTASALRSLEAQLARLDLTDRGDAELMHDRFRAMFREEVLASMPEVLDALAAIWAQHFEPDEIDQLIAFYRTPVGRKVLERMPTVMRQAQEIGARWGRQAGERALRRLEGELAVH